MLYINIEFIRNYSPGKRTCHLKNSRFWNGPFLGDICLLVFGDECTKLFAYYRLRHWVVVPSLFVYHIFATWRFPVWHVVFPAMGWKHQPLLLFNDQGDYSALARNIIEKDNINHFNVSKPWKHNRLHQKKTSKQHIATFWRSNIYIYTYVCSMRLFICFVCFSMCFYWFVS